MESYWGEHLNPIGDAEISIPKFWFNKTSLSNIDIPGLQANRIVATHNDLCIECYTSSVGFRPYYLYFTGIPSHFVQRGKGTWNFNQKAVGWVVISEDLTLSVKRIAEKRIYKINQYDTRAVIESTYSSPITIRPRRDSNYHFVFKPGAEVEIGNRGAQSHPIQIAQDTISSYHGTVSYKEGSIIYRHSGKNVAIKNPGEEFAIPMDNGDFQTLGEKDRLLLVNDGPTMRVSLYGLTNTNLTPHFIKLSFAYLTQPQVPGGFRKSSKSRG